MHFLLVPKRHIESMAHVQPSDAPLLGKLMALAPTLAKQEGCRPYPEGGFRVVCNNGPDAGQTVDHMHWHVLGGRSLQWPPG